MIRQKFKAWDNVENKMYSVGAEEDMHFYLDSEGIKAERFFDAIHYTPEGGSDVYGDSETLEHLIYLQYTGLKDKNGAEVYEGDIVNCSSGCPHEVIRLEEYGGTFVGGMPAWYLSGIKEGYAWSGEEEVIGNIYENPELLNATK